MPGMALATGSITLNETVKNIESAQELCEIFIVIPILYTEAWDLK